eukprot:tig00001085_g6963.t1
MNPVQHQGTAFPVLVSPPNLALPTLQRPIQSVPYISAAERAAGHDMLSASLSSADPAFASHLAGMLRATNVSHLGTLPPHHANPSAHGNAALYLNLFQQQPNSFLPCPFPAGSLTGVSMPQFMPPAMLQGGGSVAAPLYTTPPASLLSGAPIPAMAHVSLPSAFTNMHAPHGHPPMAPVAPPNPAPVTPTNVSTIPIEGTAADKPKKKKRKVSLDAQPNVVPAAPPPPAPLPAPAAVPASKPSPSPAPSTSRAAPAAAAQAAAAAPSRSAAAPSSSRSRHSALALNTGEENWLVALVDSIEDAPLPADDDGDAGAAERTSVLSANDIDRIFAEVENQRRQRVLHTVSPDVLSKLLALLDAAVVAGSGVPSCIDDLPEEEVTEAVAAASMGLRAALAALRIMACDEMPKRVITEEVAENAVTLLRHILVNYVFPAADPSYSPPGRKRAAAALPEPAEGDRDAGPKKRGRKSAASAVVQSLSGRQAQELSNASSRLLDGVHELVARERLPDAVLIALTGLCVTSFTVDGIIALQLSSVAVLRTIFARVETMRATVLDDVLGALLRAPSGKRSPRTFRVDLAGEECSVQMTTALLLQLFHAATELASPPAAPDAPDVAPLAAPPAGEAGGAPTPRVGRGVEASTLEGAAAACQQVCRTVVQRCLPDKELRGVLEQLMEDALALLGAPEWPAAELLAQELYRALAAVASRRTHEPMLRSYALEALGDLLARTRELSTALARAPIPAALPARPVEPAAGEAAGQGREEDSRCVCARGYREGEFMLACDRCSRWFHGPCVGIPAQTSVKFWLCDDCQVLARVESMRVIVAEVEAAPSARDEGGKKSKKGKGGEREAVVQAGAREAVSGEQRERDLLALALQASLADYLAERSRADASLLAARRFHFAWWSAEDPRPSPCKAHFFRDHWEVQQRPAAPDDPSEPPRVLSRDGARRANGALAARRALARQQESAVMFVVDVLQEAEPRLRTRALKVIAGVAAKDPAILLDARVERAVQNGLMDTSTLVREAALELVGSYVIGRPAFLEQYYSSIADRVVDAGVSVRKRAIRVLREVCMQMPEFGRAGEICLLLVRRINDEESIRELVIKTFQELWFGEAGGPAGTSLERKVAQVLSVVRGAASSDWLVSLLEKLLAKETDELADPGAAAARKRAAAAEQGRWRRGGVAATGGQYSAAGKVYGVCGQLCRHILGLLLRIEEGDEGAGRVEWGEREAGEAQTGTYRLASCMLALSVFSRVEPAFLAHAPEALRPYLKAPEGGPAGAAAEQAEQGRLLQHAALVLERVVPLWEAPRPESLNELERDLVKLVYTQQAAPVLEAVVRCLCTLVERVTHNEDLVVGIANRFFQQLVSARAKPEGLQAVKSNPEQLRRVRNVLARCLYVIGLVFRFYDMEPGEAPDAPPQPLDGPATTLAIGRAVVPAYEMYRYWFEREREEGELRARAIQGLGLLFLRRPRLMLEAREVIREALDPGAEARIKLQMLRVLCDYLVDEEALLTSRKASAAAAAAAAVARVAAGPQSEEAETEALAAAREASSAAAAAAVANYDTGVSTILMQEHHERVVALAFDSDAGVRAAAVTLLGLIFRQGLANPYFLVAPLVATETDGEGGVREQGRALLAAIDERQPTLVANRMREGVELAFTARPPDERPAATARARQLGAGGPDEGEGPLFGRQYALIQRNKGYRNAFLSSTLRRFASAGERPGSPAGARGGRGEAEAEGALLEFLAAVLAGLPYALPEEPLFLIWTINQTILARASLVLSGLRERLLAAGEEDQAPAPRDLSPADLAEARRRCGEAQALGLLLLLKRRLKLTYGLSDARCKEFDPTESEQARRAKEKELTGADPAKDRLPRRTDLEPFDPSPALVAAGPPRALSAEACLEIFRGFERLMEEDALDFTGLLDHATLRGAARRPRRRTAPADPDAPAPAASPSGETKRKRGRPRKTDPGPKKARRPRKKGGAGSDEDEDDDGAPDDL